MKYTARCRKVDHTAFLFLCTFPLFFSYGTGDLVSLWPLTRKLAYAEVFFRLLSITGRVPVISNWRGPPDRNFEAKNSAQRECDDHSARYRKATASQRKLCCRVQHPLFHHDSDHENAVKPPGERLSERRSRYGKRSRQKIYSQSGQRCVCGRLENVV